MDKSKNCISAKTKNNQPSRYEKAFQRRSNN